MDSFKAIPALYYGKVGEKMKFIVSTPKTQSGKREIPLMMDVRRQLAKQREYDRLTGTTGNARIEGYTDFVFHTFKGMPFTTAGINSLIGRIIDSYNDQERARAEEEGQKPELLPKFSAHILRHTFCTRFCENESNIKVIQEIMGHHDIKNHDGHLQSWRLSVSADLVQNLVQFLVQIMEQDKQI